MAACSPSRREVERLLGILDTYGRDECWLRVRHCYRLPEQSDQVCFEVIGADGGELRDRSGRPRTHTLQVYSSDVGVVPGQLVHVRRAGEVVRVEMLPVALDVRGSGVFGEVHRSWWTPM